MPWSTPHVFGASEVATSANMNNLSSDIAFLYGDLAWTVPTLLNGWTAAGGYSVGFRKIGITVYLRGLLGGGVPAWIFSLSAGYLPTQITNLTAWDVGTGVSQVQITPADGKVSVITGPGTTLSLDGLSFVTI